jgi:CHAD domain-containing protein
MRQGKFLIPGVGPTTPVGDAATAILVAKSRRMFDLEAAASGGADMDAVHDMRVASRRTREALSALSPAFKNKVEGELISIAKTVTRSLGAVRDADVFLAEFTEMASSTEDADQRIALAYLIGRRQAERVAALDKMRKRLGRLDLKQSRKRFRKVARDTRGSADTMALVDLARDVLSDRIDLVYMHLPAALDEENAHEQHSMRIAFKHLRYAVETFAPCFDSSFSRIHDTLVAFQNVLGEIHDLDVFAEVVSRTLDRDEAIAAGVTRAGVDEILAELAAQRAGQYRRFKRFVLQHPEERTRQRILGSLIEPPDDTLVEDAATPAESTVAEDVHPIPLGTGTALVELEPSREAGDGGGPTETIGEDPA